MGEYLLQITIKLGRIAFLYNTILETGSVIAELKDLILKTSYADLLVTYRSLGSGGFLWSH
jgi:hypothetical protein